MTRKKPNSDVDALITDIFAAHPDRDPHATLAALQDLSDQRVDDLIHPARKPLPRRTPPKDPTTLVLRVDIIGAKPPIWRRVSVPSDIHLDALHEVTQAAIGWTNSHLHRFGIAADRWGREYENILTPFDVDEDEEGVLEEELRLDELIAEPGDQLFYTYDFGDDWAHRIRVEKSLSRTADVSGCHVLAGSRAAPPEDCGGIAGYEGMLEALTDPTHPYRQEEIERASFYSLTLNEAAEFDVAAADRAVRRAAIGEEALTWVRTHPRELSPSLAALFDMIGEEAQQYLAGYVSDAELNAPVDASGELAEASTIVFRGFLNAIGDEGVSLTSAGYLPPAVVSRLMHELDPEHLWIGAVNREVNVWPLHSLRSTLTTSGLVAKRSGRIRLTKAGSAARTDSVALWRQIAQRLPVEKDEFGRNAATLLLLLTAAGEAEHYETTDASLCLLMRMLGWQLMPDDRVLPYIRGTYDVLRWAATGELASFFSAGSATATERAKLLARSALQSGSDA